MGQTPLYCTYKDLQSKSPASIQYIDKQKAQSYQMHNKNQKWKLNQSTSSLLHHFQTEI